jgi:hypothetical protein
MPIPAARGLRPCRSRPYVNGPSILGSDEPPSVRYDELAGRVRRRYRIWRWLAEANDPSVAAVGSVFGSVQADSFDDWALCPPWPYEALAIDGFWFSSGGDL